jgi:two-component system NtrC family sensor kinase
VDVALDSPESKPVEAGRLLLVDDEENILRSIRRVLRRGGWQIETAPDAARGLVLVGSFRPQVVVSDYRMPGMDGVEFLHRVKLSSPATQRIMLTGQADQHAIEEAINRSEVYRFVSKPWNDSQLVLTVRSAFEQHALQVENARLERVTREQNASLRALNAELEERVAQRTHLLSVATREWQMSFDSIDQPMAVVRTEDLAVVRANRAYARAAHGAQDAHGGRGAALMEAGVEGHAACHRLLFGRPERCPGCPVPDALASGGTTLSEVTHAGRTIVVAAHPLVEEARVVCTYRDVTDEREMTRRLVETEKMAAVGRLAGGVAHEINNPLGGILAFSQLMQRDAGRGAGDLESLQLIEESALRCKRIVESLLSFSRRSSAADRRLLPLSRCVEDACVLFRAQLKNAPGVALELAIDEGLPPLFADPIQLGQVVLNLLQNGLYAIRQKGEAGRTGTLTVRTGREGGEAFFRVTDTGTGIPAADLRHIFEPTFTTKPPGEGTGLGLSIAHRIVGDHGGRFDVQTRVGAGSTFTVFLPIPREP